MIKGSKDVILPALAVFDGKCGKPDKRHVSPCECGSYDVVLGEYTQDIVNCANCGAFRHAGGMTLRLFLPNEKDGIYSVDVGVEFEEMVQNAKAKDGKSRSKADEALSKVSIT